jgi:four helix bundle protein
MTGDMKTNEPANPSDRLESFGIYQLARQLFDDFWSDSEILMKDYRGRELMKQQVRSLDSVCANIEEGFGRGFGKELPQHLKIARGEARESRGRYERCNHLFPIEIISQRTSILSRIIGGLTKTIQTIENRPQRSPNPVTRHPPLVTKK